MKHERHERIETRAWADTDVRDLVRSSMSKLMIRAARNERLRPIVVKILNRLEYGQFYSFSIREILNRYYGVYVGAYSYGECMIPGTLPAGVVFGRYCSIAPGVRVFLRNHPIERLSMHPFFYNPMCGIVPQDMLETHPLVVGHDCWIGERAIITPGCQRIGIGAVVGAGSIVTKDVPDFAVVAGNPARLIRHRFSEEMCENIRESQWWNRPISELRKLSNEMTRSLEEPQFSHPLLRPSHVDQYVSSGAEEPCR